MVSGSDRHYTFSVNLSPSQIFKGDNMNNPNDEQIEVIDNKYRIISLRASGGCGKTEALAWFVWNNLDQYKKISMVTYTKSAAKTMEERIRISRYFDENSHFIGTLHSFADGILRQHCDLIEYDRDYRIEPGITDKLLKSLSTHLRGLDKSFKIVKEINQIFLRSNNKISNICNQVFQKEGIEAENQERIIQTIKNIIVKLRLDKQRSNKMDFDDLPYWFYILLKNNPNVAKALAKEYPVIVVDEFQDTTEIQWKALKILINNGARFLGAGDPYQTLFRFAGAVHKRFQQLENIPKCVSFQLTQNHRSTEQIISLSNSIRSQLNTNIAGIWSKDSGPSPQVILSHRKGLLVKAIIEKIRLHIEDDKIPLDDIAVTYRFNNDVNYMTDTFRKEKIPFVIFDNKDSKSDFADFTGAILNISLNQGKRDHWKKILPYLKGIGESKVKEIISCIKKNYYRYDGINRVPDKGYKKELLKLKRKFKDVILSKDNPTEAVKIIINYYVKLKKTNRLHVDDPHLVTMLKITRVSEDIKDFLINYKDSSFGQYHPFRGNTDKNYVTLSTIHKIKGKGFKVVFIIGSYDGQFKGHGTFSDKDKIRDEIMVMDTAVTRSKCHLYFLFPMTYKEWKRRAHPRNPSIFIRNCYRDLYDLYSVKYLD